jgi:hypothetical protein
MDQNGVRCRIHDGTVVKVMNLRFLGLCVSSTASWCYFIRDHAR